VSPRHYRLGHRQAAIDETRRKVLEAATTLLAEPTGYTAFTVDAVAKAADVARATVYYQFSSKTGLLEALCDLLAMEGHMDELAEAFARPDPVAGLERFVAGFGRFWGANRPVMRRLRALAAHDPEVGEVIRARDALRHQGLTALVRRLDDRRERRSGLDIEEAVRTLHAITSFETFDAIAGADREPEHVVPLVTRLVLGVLGEDPPPELARQPLSVKEEEI
jgi:AcrR family transcriptional regulator